MNYQLREEKDELKTEKDQLRALSYQLREEKDQLKAENNQLKVEKQELTSSSQQLAAENIQLKALHQQEKGEFQIGSGATPPRFKIPENKLFTHKSLVSIFCAFCKIRQERKSIFIWT